VEPVSSSETTNQSKQEFLCYNEITGCSFDSFCLLQNACSIGTRTAQSVYPLARRQDNRSRNSSSGSVKNIISFTSSRSALSPTRHPIQWVIKRPEREADHSNRTPRKRGPMHPLPDTSSWRIVQLIKRNFNLLYY
jgi:hypothetical protein